MKDDEKSRRPVLRVGEPAPWFRSRSTSNADYNFLSAAGRWIVMCFFVTAADPLSRSALRVIEECRDLFDDEGACFFGVTLDQADERKQRVRESLPGIRFFWDFDGEVSRAFGVIPVEARPGAMAIDAVRLWFILDPMLRVREIIPFAGADGGRARVAAALNSLPPVSHYTGAEVHPPILVLPDVFEPDFCRMLIRLYETHGGEDSGFMREVDGKTVGVRDHVHKRRADYNIEDQTVIEATRARVRRRIMPEIKKTH